MMEIIKPEEILAELERITQKDLECIYITTNAFDIYLNDASSLKMDTNKGITGIYFNTNVNMEKFKESIDIPSSQFIYFALFPMIVLLGLGLKIVKHYQFEIPSIIVIALYVITFIATCNYSTKLIMNIVHNQWLGYVIIFLIAVIVTYLTSTEEQMFLLLFSTVSYIMDKISSKHNYV